MNKILISLFFLSFAVNASAQVTKSVDRFFKVCMGSLGNQGQGEESAQKLGLSLANEEQKQILLRRGATGSVYVDEGLAIVLEQDGLCTIFAYADDRKAVQDDLRKALPPPSTPFKVNEEPISGNPNVTGTVYHLVLPTGPFADWIFSSYSQPGKYNIAISMQVRRTK